MKKTDIAMIVFIASVSMVIAYFVGNAVFGSATNDAVQVQTIEPIDATIVEPSKDIFNASAINPSVEVQISGTTIAGETEQTQTDPVE